MIANTKLQQGFRGFRYLWTVCAMLLMFTQQTWAADALVDTYRYSAMLDGMDQLRLKFPVYDNRGSSADTWAEGTIYVQVAGGNKETLLRYKGTRTGSDNGMPNIDISKGVDGTMVLKRAQNYSDVRPGKPDASETLYTLIKRLKPVVERHSSLRIASDRSKAYRLITDEMGEN